MNDLPWLGPDLMTAEDAKVIVGRAIVPFWEDMEALLLEVFNGRIPTSDAASATLDAVRKFWDRIAQATAERYRVDLSSLDNTLP